MESYDLGKMLTNWDRDFDGKCPICKNHNLVTPMEQHFGKCGECRVTVNIKKKGKNAMETKDFNKKMYKEETEENLEYAWALFQNLKDSDKISDIEAAYYFVENFDFKLDVLPPKLYDGVYQMIQIAAEERYYNDIAIDEIS